MLKIILGLYSFFTSIWDRLSEETKNKILDAIVNFFEDILRAFYKAAKEDEDKKNA